LIADRALTMIILRRLSIGLLLLASISFGAGPAAIRRVNFKNFSYPWSPPSDWPSQLVWLDTSQQEHVRLVNGRWRFDAKDDEGDTPFSGLTLEAVQYADVTSDGRTDAIVLLRFDTGGTQYSHYVYIYSFAAGKPKLLACFHSGDRAASGLYRVYGEGEKLVVELYDPNKRDGDCCSTGFVRTRYQWHSGKFSAYGAQEFGTTKAPSRLRVNMFGIHE